MRPISAAANLARAQQRRFLRRARSAATSSGERVNDATHAVRRAGAGIRDRTVNLLKAVFRRLRRPVRRANRRVGQLREHWAYYQTEWQIEDELETLIRRERPLVVGPWLAEVGFEALYWVPFLQWLKVAFSLSPARVIAVSRGGVAGWYQGIAERYIDIWDEIDPAEFARRNAQRNATKQYEMSPLDAEILEAVYRRLGTRDVDVVHPSVMFKLFTLYWSGQRALGFMDAHMRFTTMAATPFIAPGQLPRDYIAVKLYAARSLPDSPEMRRALRGIVDTLAEEAPVVLLDTGLVLEDDHADYVIGSGARVTSARALMTPQNNLGVQTQIIAGARAFVGTCGSIAWLAPRLGVDTSAIYVDPKMLHAHLGLAMRAYHKLGAGRFAAADLRALHPRAIASALGAAVKA